MAHYFAPDHGRVRSTAIFMSACLPVSLSARIFQKPLSKLHEMFCTCYLWPWLGYPLMTMEYVNVRYFRGFVDTSNVTFNVFANGPNTDTDHWRIIQRNSLGGARGSLLF